MKLFFVLYFLFNVKLMQAIKTMGPVGTILVNSLYDCVDEEKPKTDDLVVQAQLERDDQGKWLNVVIDSKIVLDDSMKIEIELQKFAHGKWEKFYGIKGKLCKDGKRYIPRLWDKMMKIIEPSPGPCPFQPGHYVVEKYQVVSQDIHVPAILYGAFRIKAILRDKTRKILFCRMGEGESLPPSK